MNDEIRLGTHRREDCVFDQTNQDRSTQLGAILVALAVAALTAGVVWLSIQIAARGPM